MAESSDDSGLGTDFDEDPDLQTDTEEQSQDEEELQKQQQQKQQAEQKRNRMVFSMLTESKQNEIKQRIGEVFYKLLYLSTIKQIICLQPYVRNDK